MSMSPENARRLRERQERDQQKISVADVDAYRDLHFPGSKARRDAFVARGDVEIPGDAYVAALDHDRFHEWFGTECDDTCPHRRYLPVAAVRRPSWWRRMLAQWGRP